VKYAHVSDPPIPRRLIEGLGDKYARDLFSVGKGHSASVFCAWRA
jgi:hypothetical protein